MRCLQAKGSVLASKFNGRWEAKHQVDSQGQIFLDYDPYCFKQVLAYLRSKAIERPDRPAPQPVIAPDSQAQYLALLQYLGLEEFMGKHWYRPKLALLLVANMAQLARLPPCCHPTHCYWPSCLHDEVHPCHAAAMGSSPVQHTSVAAKATPNQCSYKACNEHHGNVAVHQLSRMAVHIFRFICGGVHGCKSSGHCAAGTWTRQAPA